MLIKAQLAFSVCLLKQTVSVSHDQFSESLLLL